MDQGFVTVIFGAILGGVLCLVTAYVVIFLKKQSGKKDELTKEKIMHSIGELCAEIDSLITSNKEGILNNAGIQNAIRKKNDEIVYLLKPNMHLLDVYFVKYMDQVQKEYQKYIHGTVSDINSPLSQSRSVVLTIDSKADVAKAAENSGDKSHTVPPRSGTVEQDLHALENAFFKEPPKEPSKDSRKKTLETIFSAPAPASAAFVAPVPASPQETKKPQYQEGELSPDDLTFEENPSDINDHNSFESAFDAIFEPHASTAAAKKDENPQAAEAPAAHAEAITPAVPVAPAAGNSNADDSISEEDFTMETIIDLDVNKLTRSIPLHDIQGSDKLSVNFPEMPIQLKKEPLSVENDEVMFESAKPQTHTTENGKEKFVSQLRNAADQHPVRPKPIISKVFPEVVIGEKKDIEITGDDVAKKIDNFFGFDDKL